MVSIDHVFLSIKVLTGICLIFCGLYGVFNAIRESDPRNADAIAYRGLSFGIVMLAGLYIITTCIYPR